VFLFRLFNGPRWELGNPSQLASFCTHAAAMTSLKRIELKLGTKEPSTEEAKRSELKLPMEIKRNACIHCRGCVPIRAIASRYPVDEEVSTPFRRSACIRGMKRND
jgi:RNase P subunit RPR2